MITLRCGIMSIRLGAMDNQAFQLVSDALKRIEAKLDDVTSDHHERIDSLESTRDQQRGMVRIGIALATFAGGAVSFLLNLLFKHH